MRKNLTNWDQSVTVVIATLGESTLLQTIESLSVSSVRPHKILICIPNDKIANLPNLTKFSDLVEIVSTKEKGQVIQRAIGFRKSQTKYTLQLDSDVVLVKDCLENLIKCIEKYPNSSIGPVIYNEMTRERLSYLTTASKNLTSLDKKILFYVANGSSGFIPGTISKCGENFGTIESHTDNYCEWLPGGCVLHNTTNLVLDDFYPFKGKAYSEDLLHSYLLRERKVSLIESHLAKIFTHSPPAKSLGIMGFIKVQVSAFRVKFYLANLWKKSKN